MLSLSSERRGPYTVVKVAGNLDLITRDQFDQFMTKARRDNSQVIIDMSAVTFMDTGCLAVIVGHWKKLLSGSGNLILAGPQYLPAKALWITGRHPANRPAPDRLAPTRGLHGCLPSRQRDQ